MENRLLRWKWFLAAALSCALFANGRAGYASPEKLTVAQAVEVAITNNPALRDAQKRLAAAQARVAVAKSEYYPQVSFNGIGKLGLSGATNGLGLLGLPASPFYRNLADAANVNQNIFDFGRTCQSAAVARAEVEAAQDDVEAVRLQVSGRAKESFLKVLRAQQGILESRGYSALECAARGGTRAVKVERSSIVGATSKEDLVRSSVLIIAEHIPRFIGPL